MDSIENVNYEWERLVSAKRNLNRYIKPGDKILELSGGPGGYSLDFAVFGCDVFHKKM